MPFECYQYMTINLIKPGLIQINWLPMLRLGNNEMFGTSFSLDRKVVTALKGIKRSRNQKIINNYRTNTTRSWSSPLKHYLTVKMRPSSFQTSFIERSLISKIKTYHYSPGNNHA